MWTFDLWPLDLVESNIQGLYSLQEKGCEKFFANIFCTHSGLRLWRTGMLFSTKSKGHKSNVRISWMYRYRFYDLKVHFWWPNKRLKCNISSWHTLYVLIRDYLYLYLVLIVTVITENSVCILNSNTNMSTCVESYFHIANYSIKKWKKKLVGNSIQLQ